MSEHTPGPWRLLPARNQFYRNAWENQDYTSTMQRCYYLAGPDHDSHFVADVIVEAPGETGPANASLIAAAPDLLAACKAVMDSEGDFVLPRSVSAAVRAAIAKATQPPG